MKRINLLFIVLILLILFLVDISLPDFENLDIIFNLRLPRSISIVLTGWLLAGAGFIVQRLTGNLLADPFIIGTSSGAMTGILISEFFKFSPYGFFYFLTVNSFAVLTVYISWWLSLYFSRHSNIIFSGVAVNSIVLSFIVLYVIFSRDTTINFFHISFGSFSYSDWNSLIYAFMVSLVSFFIIFLIWKDIIIISFNQDKSISLGVSEKTIRFFAFISASFMTSVSVSLSGIIGFVGLMSPHISVLFSDGKDHLSHFILTIIIGSLLLIISDVVSRYFFYPIEIPPGVLTSIAGSIFFLYLVINKKG